MLYKTQEQHTTLICSCSSCQRAQPSKRMSFAVTQTSFGPQDVPEDHREYNARGYEQHREWVAAVFRKIAYINNIRQTLEAWMVDPCLSRVAELYAVSSAYHPQKKVTKEDFMNSVLKGQWEQQSDCDLSTF